MKNIIVFATGTGRCGTHLISKLLCLESNVASSHERNPLNEAFHRYCKWYKLPVDDEGFLSQKELEIKSDLLGHNISFEASSLLSMSIAPLYERFDSKFILLLRRPELVVNSLLHKGENKNVIKWYELPYYKKDLTLAPGYQSYTHFHHFLGRISPRGKSFKKWNALTRVGKLSWFWSTVNHEIIKQFSKIPNENYRIQKIEQMDFRRYRELCQFLGFKSSISEVRFNAEITHRPTFKHKDDAIIKWADLEKREFETEVKAMAQKLKYEWRTDVLKTLYA